ncbi:MAG: CPBP family glutamic-type intramembrane protease [Armatimonadota bacterium]
MPTNTAPENRTAPASPVRLAAPYVPYLAVIAGMYLLHSAWASVFLYHLGMAGVLLVERRWGEARKLGAGLQPLQMTATGFFGLSGGVLLYLLWPLLGLPAGFADSLANLGITKAVWPLFLGYFCLVNPWLEEVYWRGYLRDDAARPVPNDALFAGYHVLVMASFVWWPWLIVVLLGLTGAGWLWRQQARLTKGLVVPMVSHLIADASILLTVYLFATK